MSPYYATGGVETDLSVRQLRDLGGEIFFIPSPGLGLWAYGGKLLGRNA